jgi:murein endopeptidase
MTDLPNDEESSALAKRDSDLSPAGEDATSAAPPPDLAGQGKPDLEPEPPKGADAGPSSSKPRERSFVGVLFVMAGVAWAVAGYGRARRNRVEPPPVAVAGELEAAQFESRASSPAPGLERTSGQTLRGDSEDEALEASPTEAEALGTLEGTEGAPEPAIGGEPLPPEEPTNNDWVEAVESPGTVTYTVRHGGSIKNVANLFKIFHHEIVELNPGYTLEQQLPPNTKVVVWKQDEDEVSESVGYPGAGSLHGAVPMMEGPGRVLKATPWKAWATHSTVTTLDAILREWARRKPEGQPVLVGNLSAPEGGKLKPHSSHQSGRDVDLSYIQIRNPKEELNWREMTAANLDAEQTWDLLKLLRQSGKVEVIFIDSKIQKLLYEHAVSNRTVSKSSLSRWLEYPRQPGTTGALVRHVPGHRDHIHARFRCPREQSRCKSQ